MENKIRNNSNSFGGNTSRNNSFNNTTTIDLFKEKTFPTHVISQQKQTNVMKETVPMTNIISPKITIN